MTILTPQEFKTRFVSKESIYAFNMSMIIGILTHIYPLTHRFFIEDYHYAFNVHPLGQIAVGRWFLAFFNSYLDGYIIPSLSTLIGIVFYALIVVTLINAFKIKEKFILFVFSGIIMTFPAIASAIGYMITIENSSTSIFLSVFGFYLANKSRKYAIIGALPLCLAIAGYQAYISFSISLCLISLLLLTLESDTSLKDIINKTLDFLFFGIIGVGLYLLITKALLIHYHLELATYFGLDKMGHIPFSLIPSLVVNSYKGYFDFIFGNRFLYASMPIVIINIIFIIINIFLFAVCIRKTNLIQNPYKVILSLILLMLLPFAYNSLDFLSINRNTLHGAFPFVFTYLMPFILISKFGINKMNNKTIKLNSWVITICIIIMLFDFVKITEIYYHKVDIAYGNTAGIINRMIMKIDETEGFNYDIPIAFAGSLAQSDFYNFNFNFDYRETNYMRGLWGPYVGFTRESDVHKFVNLCNNYFGTRYKVSSANLEEITASEEYMNMPEYPKNNSIKIIDGTLVIKLSYHNYVDIKQTNDNTYSFRYETDDKSFDHNNYTYAWYVWKDDIPISKVYYQDNDIYTYQFNESGNYHITVFLRNKQTNLTELSINSKVFTIE